MRLWIALSVLTLGLIGCGKDDEVEYNEEGILKANKVGTKLVSSNLFQHDGRTFNPVRLHNEPRFYLFYYSGSW